MPFEDVDAASGFEAAAVRRSYDAVAAEYAETFADELAGKPLDRRLVEELASRAGTGALVIDLGCGPGQAGELLAAAGVVPVGLDLSPGMLALTRQRRAAAGDLRALPLRDRCAAAGLALYCLQHLPRADLVSALREIRRTLVAGGALLMSAHLGEGDLHASEWFGHDVDLSGALYDRDEFKAAMTAAGFTLVDAWERDADPEEHPSRRLYLLATA